ncbi:MAG: sialate O-acetylesterase [Polyangiaceae bacterium]
MAASLLVAVCVRCAPASSSNSPGSSSGGNTTHGGNAPTGGSLSAGGSIASGGLAAGGSASGGTASGGAAAVASGGAAAGGMASGGTSAGAAGAGAAGAAGATSGGVNDVDVYFIGGQSNATGQGYSSNIPLSFTVDTRVRLYHSSGIVSSGAANTWLTLRAASEGADGCNLGLRFGPELGFGNAIQAFYPARKIYLIKHATSNTGLAVDWAPGSGPSDTSHFGPEFKTFASTVDAGLKALTDQGLKPSVRGMLWQQGERDVDSGGAAAENYGKNLVAFIARVREQWSSPNLLFVYGFIYPASNYGTARDQVRKAQAEVDQDSGTALATKGAFVVNGDAFSLRANEPPGTCYPGDKIHFGTQGQLDLGQLMASKMHDKLTLP